MTHFPYINDWTEAVTRHGRFLVHRHGIASTPFVVYEAWEPLDGHRTVSYSTPLGPIGAVGSRPLPEWAESLRPGTPERIAAAAEHRGDVAVIALEAIYEAYPDVMERDGARVDGWRVETHELAAVVA